MINNNNKSQLFQCKCFVFVSQSFLSSDVQTNPICIFKRTRKKKKKKTEKEKSKQRVCLVCEEINIHLKEQQGYRERDRVCCIAAGQSLLQPPLLSSCAAQLGLRDHAAGLDSSLARCSPAGADGAPGVRLRVPASPIRGHGESSVCSA